MCTRLGFKTALFFLAAEICVFPSHSQPKVFSLNKVIMTNASVPFHIKSVIDARKDQTNIGWVQTGLANKKRFAVLERPLEQEIIDLFTRSKLPTESNFTGILRIDHIYISEQTTAMSETAKAELNITFFVKSNDTSYYNVGNIYASFVSRGVEVTSHHPANLAKAFEQALIQFGKPTRDEVLDTTRYTYDEIKEANLFKIDVTTLPIVTSGQYEDGIYSTLSEFRINKPSIKGGYQVTEGKNLKARWTSGEKVNKNVFAMAHANKLYILFHNNFYPLILQNGEFHFVGPSVPDSGAMMAGGLLGGLIGGAIAGGTTSKRTKYNLDLITGALIAEESAR